MHSFGVRFVTDFRNEKWSTIMGRERRTLSVTTIIERVSEVSPPSPRKATAYCDWLATMPSKPIRNLPGKYCTAHCTSSAGSLQFPSARCVRIRTLKYEENDRTPRTDPLCAMDSRAGLFGSRCRIAGARRVLETSSDDGLFHLFHGKDIGHVSLCPRYQHDPASSRVARPTQAGLPGVSRRGRVEQMAAAERVHRQGAPHGRPRWRHLQDVVHEFQRRQRPLVPGNLSRPQAASSYPLHVQSP